jgi:hypothetical protein
LAFFRGIVISIGHRPVRVCATTVLSPVVALTSLSSGIAADQADSCTTNLIDGSLPPAAGTLGLAAISNTVGGLVYAETKFGAGPCPNDTTACASGNHKH